MPTKERSKRTGDAPVLPLLTTEGDQITQRLLKELRAAMPHEQIDLLQNFTASELARVDVALSANPEPTMFAQLPNLSWLQSLWAGVENIVGLAEEKHFELARLIDPQLAEAMSEAALAWTLYLQRCMPEYAIAQRSKVWQQLHYQPASDCTVSLLGLGELGRASAKRLLANGFRVSGFSRTEKSLPGVTTYQGDAGLQEMLAHTDILLILLPLTPATRGLIDQQTLAMLPRGSAIINFARGPLIVTDDLLQALDQGQLRHAVLDVFDEEPLPEASALWHHDRVTVLPHIAAPTDAHSAARIVATNIDAYRKSGELPPIVDLRQGF